MPPRQGSAAGIIIAVVAAVLVVPVLGILAIIGIYGVRKYIANAKTAEARNTLAQISKNAVAAYEGNDRHLCPSASAPVPADRSLVSGRKYQSTRSEWTAEGTRAGFGCLKFETTGLQYFQYEYEATPTSFVARAHGDLNGDGVFSDYELHGKVIDGRLVLAPTILEIDPYE